jgi:hypothetical protein
LRLMTPPQPGELDQRRSQPWIAGFRNLPARVAPCALLARPGTALDVAGKTGAGVR